MKIELQKLMSWVKAEKEKADRNLSHARNSQHVYDIDKYRQLKKAFSEMKQKLTLLLESENEKQR